MSDLEQVLLVDDLVDPYLTSLDLVNLENINSCLKSINCECISFEQLHSTDGVINSIFELNTRPISGVVQLHN